MKCPMIWLLIKSFLFQSNDKDEEVVKYIYENWPEISGEFVWLLSGSQWG